MDAQDLVRLHDGCATAPLEKDFKESFDALRVRRNSIMHTIDRRLKIHVVELIESILKIHKTLVPQRDWINSRREALSESASVTLFSADWVEPRIVKEFSVITDTLSPSAMKEYFGFNKKQRTIYAPTARGMFSKSMKRKLKPRNSGQTPARLPLSGASFVPRRRRYCVLTAKRRSVPGMSSLPNGLDA